MKEKKELEEELDGEDTVQKREQDVDEYFIDEAQLDSEQVDWTDSENQVSFF